MASKFITNNQQDSSLSALVKNLTKKSDELNFLVGYFFFTGFTEISNDILDKKIQILVGMDAEITIKNYIREYVDYSSDDSKKISKNKIRENYYNIVQTALNQADNFDNKEFAKSYNIFKDKLKKGKLEVRKTKNPNHAKMYLFHIPKNVSNSGYDDGKVIIGSSNFSIQGFKARNEINVYLQDDNDYKDGKKIFDSLWNEAIPLVDTSNKEEFISKVLEHTWLEQLPSPYLMYVRVLDEYFKINNDDYIKTPKQITRNLNNEFFDISYQVDAIRDGVAKIKKHSGCIIADVVGLGKSVIAASIAANLDLPSNIIITPPHLESQWKDYISDFGLRGGVTFTSGKLKEAVNKNINKGEQLIIIDEAHRYRNENTESYGLLHQLCAGNKVILLSATPFNNKPDDIFALIKLFQIPTNSTIQTVNNLADQIELLSKKYNKLRKEHLNKEIPDDEFNRKVNQLAGYIRDILDPVIIRRTRIDLEQIDKYREDLIAQGIKFSNVNKPSSQNYDLGNLSQIYINTLNKLTAEDGFKGTRYQPLNYLKKDKSLIIKYAKYFNVENFKTGQQNMAKFMKQLLVRRFESSKYSFEKTLENIKKSMEDLRKLFVEEHKVPMAKKNIEIPDENIDYTDDTNEEFLNENYELLSNTSKKSSKNSWFIDAEDLSDAFLTDLDADIALIETFIEDWKNIQEDPKLVSIIHSINDSLQKDPKRKIIIFTEFADTAEYLYKAFYNEQIKVTIYTSKIANKGTQRVIKSNFDAGLPKKLQREDFDVLIATDAISEGFSLHRAGTIYNYDIPYNPTRVIQRIGRINRINKKVFDNLYIYNFFPTATGEDVSHTTQISTFKMKLFQAILGIDTQVLTAEETIEGYLGNEFTEAENNANEKSWDVDFHNEWNRISNYEPDILQQARAIAQKSRIKRQGINLSNYVENSNDNELFATMNLQMQEQENAVLLFSKKADAYKFTLALQSGETLLLSPEQALNIFKCNRNEKPFSISDNFWHLYQQAKIRSGMSEITKTRSKNLQEVNIKLQLLKNKYDSPTINNAKNSNDVEYIAGMLQAVNLESFPSFYLKEISKLNLQKENPIENLKEIIPEKYLANLLEKYRKANDETEIILLAEELNLINNINFFHENSKNFFGNLVEK